MAERIDQHKPLGKKPFIAAAMVVVTGCSCARMPTLSFYSSRQHAMPAARHGKPLADAEDMGTSPDGTETERRQGARKLSANCGTDWRLPRRSVWMGKQASWAVSEDVKARNSTPGEAAPHDL